MVVELIEPLTKTVSLLMNTIQILVGGIFGIYVVSLIWNFYEGKRRRKMLKEIQIELKTLRSQMKRIEKSDIESRKKLDEIMKKLG